MIVGISEDTKGCHIVRATLDAVCYQTRDILEAMNKDYGSHLNSIQVNPDDVKLARNFASNLNHRSMVV